MSAIQLNGPQQGKLHQVLKSAFDPNTFAEMLLYRLDRKVHNIAPINANFETTLFAVIDRANMEGWLGDLVVKAREANPKNPQLLAFTYQFGLSSFDPVNLKQEFERTIKPENPMLDFAVYLQQAAEIEPRVCRIEYETDQGKVINGTGFLFGCEDAVMTNYHVMEPVIKRMNNETTAEGHRANAKSVECRFDFKRTGTGSVVNPGVKYSLADNWLIDASLNFPLDQAPPADRLDYALIRLSTAAGDDTVGASGNRSGEKRGFIPMPADPVNPQKDSILGIVQHPRGLPLKFATDTVLGLNDNETCLRYQVNTEPGSSGSPCFTLKWELVGLHHSGDPDFDPAHKPTYNEGITMKAITKLIKDRGVQQKLVKQDVI